jgi:ferredoxin
MNYAAQEKRIRELAAKIIASGGAPLVIGFKKQAETGRCIPAFAGSEQECRELVWDRTCGFNLAAYLNEIQGKVAVVMKPCDARLAVNLIVEGQLDRKNLVIIGVQCDGMLYEGKTAPSCRVCDVPTPPIYDYFVDANGGDDASKAIKSSAEELKTEKQDILELSPEERREKFNKELDKCILCFACRQACAGCYCKTCFMDRNMVDWSINTPTPGDKKTYHLTRMMHLAGRCVGCGACEKACPSGVDLSYINSALRDFIGEAYGYKAGMDPAARQVMNSFSADDRQIGFLGGE